MSNFISPLSMHSRGYQNTPSGDYNIARWAQKGVSARENVNRFEASFRLFQAKNERLPELDLSNLKLTSLPPGLGNLNFLHTLNLSGNCLTELPKELKNLLPCLKVLKISNNAFKHIPKKLREISDLNLEPIPFEALPLEPPRLSKERIRSIKIKHAEVLEAFLKWNHFSLNQLSSSSIAGIDEDCEGTPYEEESSKIHTRMAEAYEAMTHEYAQARRELKGLPPMPLLVEEKDEELPPPPPLPPARDAPLPPARDAPFPSLAISSSDEENETEIGESLIISVLNPS